MKYFHVTPPTVEQCRWWRHRHIRQYSAPLHQATLLIIGATILLLVHYTILHYTTTIHYYNTLHYYLPTNLFNIMTNIKTIYIWSLFHFSHHYKCSPYIKYMSPILWPIIIPSAIASRQGAVNDILSILQFALFGRNQFYDSLYWYFALAAVQGPAGQSLGLGNKMSKHN